jgi:hypothetical protein
MAHIYVNTTQASILLIALTAARNSNSAAYTSSECGKAALNELIAKVNAAIKRQPKDAP